MRKSESEKHWERVESLFWEAVELSGKDLEAFLESAVVNDEELKEQIRKMVANAKPTKLIKFEEKTALADWGKEEQSHSELLLGQKIGFWILKEVIGEGGMGEVFLAERTDSGFNQKAALKIVRPGALTKSTIRRFKAERQLLARLDHPYIAGLLDGGLTDDQVPYLVMEYVDGSSILEYAKEQKLNTKAKLDLFCKVCEAVEAAHRSLIVHRDLKPANVLVKENGDVKLLDFGIAKILAPDFEETGEIEVTKTGQQLLTPSYAAPEQILDESITTATDVYALGVLLFELVSEKRPYSFENRSRTELVKVVCETKAPTLSTKSDKKEFKGDLDMIVAKALMKEPTDRYQSAQLFLADIQKHLGGLPIEARRPSAGYRLRKFVGRNKTWVAAASLAAVLFGGTVTSYTIQLKNERDVSNAERDRADETTNFLVGLFQSTDPYSGDPVNPEGLTALDILDKGRASMDEDLADEPELRARLKNTLSEVYSNLGQYDLSATMAEQALTEETLELNERIKYSIVLATALYNRGSYAKGDSVLNNLSNSVPAHEKVGIIWAGFLDIHGLVKEALSEYDASRSLLNQSLAIRREDQGRHVATASTLSNLSHILSVLDLQVEQKEVLEEALEINQELLPANHPDLVTSLNNLAVYEMNNGDVDKAISLYKRVIDSDSAVLGTTHPEALVSRNNLAIALEKKGLFEKAEEEFLAILRDYRSQGRTDQRKVNTYLNNLGRVSRKRGNIEVSIGYFREALQASSRPIDISTSSQLLSQSLLLMPEAAKHREALILCSESKKIVERTFDHDHWQRTRLNGILGIAMLRTNSDPLGEVLAINAYETTAQDYGSDSGNAQWLYEQLSQYYMGNNDKTRLTKINEIKITNS